MYGSVLPLANVNSFFAVQPLASVIYNLYILIYREQNNVYYDGPYQEQEPSQDKHHNTVVGQIGWKFQFNNFKFLKKKDEFMDFD